MRFAHPSYDVVLLHEHDEVNDVSGLCLLVSDHFHPESG